MVKWLFFLACSKLHLPPDTTFSATSATVGTVESREQVLIAYRAQFNQDSNLSMQSFANARNAAPQEAILLLLWADSAWEQGQTDLARKLWRNYLQTLSPDDTTELERIRFKLEQP